MQQLILELLEALAQRLAWLAATQKKSIEQVALERLTRNRHATVRLPGSHPTGDA